MTPFSSVAYRRHLRILSPYPAAAIRLWNELFLELRYFLCSSRSDSGEFDVGHYGYFLCSPHQSVSGDTTGYSACSFMPSGCWLFISCAGYRRQNGFIPLSLSMYLQVLHVLRIWVPLRLRSNSNNVPPGIRGIVNATDVNHFICSSCCRKRCANNCVSCIPSKRLTCSVIQNTKQ